MTYQDRNTSPSLPCNLCGADDCDALFEAGEAQVARIVKCRHCGLIYANPRGQLVDHEDYEQWEATNLLDGMEDNPTHPWRWRLDKEALQVRDFRNTRKILNRLHPQKGKMVEVGSGLGYLLKSFKDEGWEVEGVDPWRELPSFTRRVHGLNTIPQTLEQAKLQDECADVVILLHVIEHVPDPIATMTEIFRVLKPGGHMVLETPRYDTLMFRLMGKRERSLRQDGHIYFYTHETLQRSYEKVGFKEVDTSYIGRSLSAERFIWNLANITKSERFTNTMTAASRRIGLQHLKFTLNLHDMIRIVVAKPQT